MSQLLAWLADPQAPGATAAVLVLAFLIGVAVGAERGMSTSSVGIRTCTLVALASAAFADLIIRRVPDAQWGTAFGAVVTGVGFLGAGAIIKGGGPDQVRGLGEAGTIWCVAVIGLLLGAREVVTAVLVCGLVLIINLLLRPLAAWIDMHRAQRKPEDDVLDG